MSLYRIENIDGLRRHLQAAIQLEHATIPPYLSALYSIHPGTNSDAYHIIRVVAVEEMLHLTLAANMLNAVGGTPDLSHAGFVPLYPAYLPNGETDFQASCQRFSRASIENFMQIERPATGAAEGAETLERDKTRSKLRASRVDDDGTEHFYSIGEFYEAIQDGLVRLHDEMGDDLFTGDPEHQITSELYYSGGAELFPVRDLDSAKQAIRLISEQGEGHGGSIFDYEGEISHYYRFEQILLGQYYEQGDEPGKPSGGKFEVDWDAVYPIRPNARLSDYPEGSALREAAVNFNAYYGEFLDLLTRSLTGEPQLFVDAVGGMFRIKELCYQLMRQPLDGTDGEHAAPTFEIPGKGEAKQ